MDFKKAIIILIVLVVVFIFSNYPSFTKISFACEEPINYSVGVFDKRFGISYKTFLSVLTQAEAIWEKPMGKELFVYAPENSDLTINLIYDSRQETTSTLSNISDVLEENKAAYKTLQIKYIGLKKEYDSLKDVYDTRVSTFNEKNFLYQSHVDNWNSGKRNSRELFDQLERERTALEIDVEELKILEGELNDIVSGINTLVGTLNRLARSLNLKVDTYNTIGASRGETFTGGIYHSAEGVQDIDVYEFSSRDKLVRVLAHELGHALGLAHVDDKDSMMYHLNESDAQSLSKTDLMALRTLCRIK
ncbi:MAG: matrixin family metalloprotease [bacterium]|nr:matrixin family metalloprotease [bacterium]